MKSGASDPFADDNEEEEATESGSVEESALSDGQTTDEATAGTDSASTPSEPTTSEDASGDAESAGESASADEPLELPYIYRRDKVKDERPDVHQLFVRDETDSQARDAERDLEKLLGEDVYRLDAREAIYLAGMRHLDEAADVLREWGYDR